MTGRVSALLPDRSCHEFKAWQVSLKAYVSFAIRWKGWNEQTRGCRACRIEWGPAFVHSALPFPRLMVCIRFQFHGLRIQVGSLRLENDTIYVFSDWPQNCISASTGLNFGLRSDSTVNVGREIWRTEWSTQRKRPVGALRFGSILPGLGTQACLRV